MSLFANLIHLFSSVTFDDPSQALEFAQAKVEGLVAYCSESSEEGKIGQCNHTIHLTISPPLSLSLFLSLLH